ncbi:MAG: hypothetical protein ACK47B_23820 [Armatimonadota bacterium]
MSYCDASDVLDGPLKGLDLSTLGDSAAQTAYVTALLDASKLMVDQAAERDFDLHTDDVVELDGNGADRLAVWKDDRTLCVPIVSVSAISVYGSALDLTDLKVDSSAGIVGFQAAGSERLALRRGMRGRSSTFPRDFRNVEITLTWGYAAPPADVVLAQALVTACLVVLTLGGGVSGGLLRKKIEDFEVQYGEGQYRQQVKEWTTRALTILNHYGHGRRMF